VVLGTSRHVLTRRAAVLGSPVSHSLSPILHRAAYEALGLTSWDYGSHDVQEGALAAFIAGLDESWVGLSLTMPLKEAALALATSSSAVAQLTGAANTLLRHPGGWLGDNTDVHGVRMALAEAGVGADVGTDGCVIVGSGATARAVLVALSQIGVQRVSFVVREEVRPPTRALALRLGLHLSTSGFDAGSGTATIVVNTVPGGAADPLASVLPATDRPRALLDVIYGAAPSLLVATARRRGWRGVDGTRMLLHQAGEQVRLMTGFDPPLAAMDAALAMTLAARASEAVDDERHGQPQSR
jgi:shikimate dehydrogenase